jgi:uroporphyrin-III C-methyltransferase/precorrin-2 dehydrogenase/sirohydrochlorin ferrochelatase
VADDYGRPPAASDRDSRAWTLAPGTVSLVGAGPGDPDLLTLRAVRRLREADLVLYDALVDPEVLTLARSAQRIFVGKRAARPAVRQEFINRLLIRAARRGRKVVRLKGGDPFVFGRGGEEALALVAAGIPFEIVPGVSSAIAAPALAGVPVTHRGTSAAFLVVSGHSPSAYGPVLGSLAPNAATVVVMMGLSSAFEISTLLVERGWKPATPAAVLSGASTREAETWIGTLADLAAGVESRDTDAPGTIVIGEVVRIGAMLATELDRATNDDEDEPVSESIGAGR